jgi:ring-1,2-phenylacetyl-CoA epoxidase subunit PaaC
VTAALVSIVTALADDELILGHRHSEWTGYAPHIEEDVAFSSIAQDEIGHAGNLYELVAEITGGDADRLALGRELNEYRHAILCERPNRDWAYTLARHWLYDTADAIRLEALQDTAHDALAALVTKIRREERYHLLHADTWMRRIARGPVEGRTNLVHAMSEAFGEAIGLFEPFEGEEAAVKEGWLPVPSPELRQRFIDRTMRELDELGLPSEIGALPEETAEFVASSSGDLIATEDQAAADAPHGNGLGGRRGRRSPDFEPLWTEMTVTYRGDPEASW